MAEDEKRMAEALCQILMMEGYEAEHFADGRSALDAIMSGTYDMAILDVMMPGMNGYELTRELRRSGIRMPVLMLTAKDDIDDKVDGLDAGADDYLTKPFVTRELLARIRSLSRRAAGNYEEELAFGDIAIDKRTLTLSCSSAGGSVKLSEKEYRILEYMILNKGQILTREQLAVKIWGYDNNAEYNNVEVYMSFTRKKLAFTGAKTEIKAVRSIGYELRYNDAEQS